MVLRMSQPRQAFRAGKILRVPVLTQLRQCAYREGVTDLVGERRGVIPSWTQGWRLQRALSHAGMTTEQMADELGVARSTVSRWCNDKGHPTRGYLKLWAIRTGVSYDWLSDEANRPLTPTRSTTQPGNLADEQGPPGTAELADVKGALRKRIPLRPPVREPQMRAAVAL